MTDSLTTCPLCGADAPGVLALCDSCDERAAMDAEAFDAPASFYAAVSPEEARALAIAEDAAVVLDQMRRAGVPFDAAARVSEAEEYSYLLGGSTLALPFDLVHVGPYQTALGRIADALDAVPTYTGPHLYPATIHATRGPSGRPVVVLLAETTLGEPSTLRTLGQLPDEDAGWLAPVLDATPSGRVPRPVRAFVTAVTGEGPLGCRVVLAGVPDACRDAEAEEARRQRAYESGSRTAVEAAM